MEGIMKYATVFAVFAVLYYFMCIPQHKAIPKAPDGFAAPGWEKVAKVFRDQVESGRLRGGAFSVYHKGELVIEVFGGYADDEIFWHWSNDTLSQYFSSTKAVAAVVIAMLVERGLLDYNKPVSHYWPEFAQNGKQDITINQVLSHQAGLAVTDQSYSFIDVLEDNEKISRILAAQRPNWKIEEGNAPGYQVVSIGLYEDQLVRRVDPKGRSLSQFFQDEVAELFDIDFFIGLPKSQNYRCARNINAVTIKDVIYASQYWALIWKNRQHDSWCYKAFNNPKHAFVLHTNYNQPKIRESPSPATHGYGTATSLAKFFGILANGGKYKNRTLLNENYIKLLQEPLVSGYDKVLHYQMTYGRGNSIWKSPKGNNVFGAPGAGGQVGKCDPDNKLALSFLTNHMIVYTLGDGPNYLELEKAVYETIDDLK